MKLRTGNCAATYKALESERNAQVEIGDTCSSFTLTYLQGNSDGFGQRDNSIKRNPWNGVGQKGVQTIVAKLLLSLLPPTEQIFRLTIDEIKLATQQQQMLQAGAQPEELAKQKTEFDLGLARLERVVLNDVETSNDRLAIQEALTHLVVYGNALIYIEKDGLKCFPMRKYVLKRDAIGNPLECVICEKIGYQALPEAVKQMLVEEDGEIKGVIPGEDAPDYQKNIEVYTHVYWETNKVNWYQEVKGVEVEGQRGSAPLDESPFLPLRMYRIDGESYSPSYIEAVCLADLRTAEALSQAITEGALIAAQTKHLVKPSSVVNPKKLAEAANGAYLAGNPDDVFTIRTDKGNDMQVALQSLATVEARLSKSFMLHSPRDAERVTAEENRILINEIEASLGSVFSILSQELVRPYIARKLVLLTRRGKLPTLPNDLVKPVISVGLRALGRSNDLEKTARFMQILQQTIGPEGIGTYVDTSELIRRLASSMGMELSGLIKTEEQIAQEQEQAQQQAMMQQAMQSGMADPQKLANAAATSQEMAQPQPTEEQQ